MVIDEFMSDDENNVHRSWLTMGDAFQLPLPGLIESGKQLCVGEGGDHAEG